MLIFLSATMRGHYVLKTSSVIIYAPGIHSGGGVILLECLLREFIDPKDTFHLFLDKRAMKKIDKKIIENQKVSFVSSGFWQRLKAEARLFKATNKATRVICFSNIPPFFPWRFLKNNWLKKF